MFRDYRILVVGLVSIAWGCSNKPSRIAQPRIDADGVATKAVAMFDQDGDNVLSSDELSSVSSLARSFGRLDSNGDKQLESDEIAARIRAWQDYGAGLIPATCTVFRKGKPVKGATVTYSPEEFFRESITFCALVS
ncbi:hypothetical protein OAS39_01365 [Pirellulales bacterium]|nr:hypothetical protein [Pirellulales bacterium]